MVFQDLIIGYEERKLYNIREEYARLTGILLQIQYFNGRLHESGLTLQEANLYHRNGTVPSEENIISLADRIEEFAGMRSTPENPVITLEPNNPLSAAGRTCIGAKLRFYKELLDREAKHPNSGSFKSYEAAVKDLFLDELLYRVALQPIDEAEEALLATVTQTFGQDSPMTSAQSLMAIAEQRVRENSIEDIFLWNKPK